MAEQEKNTARELIAQVAGAFTELMKEFERIELAMAERSSALARAETAVAEREKQCAERERLVTIRETESRHITQIASERPVIMKTAQEAAQQCSAARKQSDKIVACRREPKRISTPECDKLARAEGHISIRGFLGWLRGEPEWIEKIQRSESACEEAVLLYLGIDPKKLEAERRAILAERGDS